MYLVSRLRKGETWREELSTYLLIPEMDRNTMGEPRGIVFGDFERGYQGG